MASSSHLVFKPPCASSFLLLVKPLCLSSSLTLHHLNKSLPTLFLIPSPRPSRFLFCNSSSSVSPPPPSSLTSPGSLSPSLILEQDNDSEEDFEQKEEPHSDLSQDKQEEDEEAKSKIPIITEEAQISSILVDNSVEAAAKLPSLTVKEKKELSAYAHSLGKKLKIQQVGKSGITDSVAASFVENLESNELLKLKIHNSCPGELRDVIKQLELTTGSVAVAQIGRSVILYRPSLTKLKAEEKKRQERRVYVGKGFRPKPTVFRVKANEFRSKSDEPKMEKRGVSSRGNRGKSRAGVS